MQQPSDRQPTLVPGWERALGALIIDITRAQAEDAIFSSLASGLLQIVPADRASVALLTAGGEELTGIARLGGVLGSPVAAARLAAACRSRRRRQRGRRVAGRTDPRPRGLRRARRDGLAVLELFAEHGERLAAVVLDVTMPGMSSDELFRELLDNGLRAPAIVSSGFAETEALATFRADAVTGSLHKPYRAHELVDRVHRAVGTPAAHAV